MKEIILVGGGGHCKSVIDVIEQENQFMIAGIVDKPELLGTNVSGYSIFASDSDLDELSKDYTYALITIGQIQSSELRMKLFDRVKKSGFSLPKIISPRAYVSQYANIGLGTVVMHDALINTGVSVGDNCIINSKAIIEHDSKISNHCHISTNSVVNGGATICEGSFIGSGAVVVNSIVIKKNSFIRAGTVAS